jgi:hypothetical protein
MARIIWAGKRNVIREGRSGVMALAQVADEDHLRLWSGLPDRPAAAGVEHVPWRRSGIVAMRAESRVVISSQGRATAYRQKTPFEKEEPQVSNLAERDELGL